LRETAITFFSDLSILMKEDMAPIFNQVIDNILKTCHMDDETNEIRKEKAGGFSLDTDSEEGSI